MPFDSYIFVRTVGEKGYYVIGEIVNDFNGPVHKGSVVNSTDDFYSIEVSTNLIKLLSVMKYEKNDDIIKVLYPWEIKNQSMYDSDKLYYSLLKTRTNLVTFRLYLPANKENTPLGPKIVFTNPLSR
jgi:hypothetical protein